MIKKQILMMFLAILMLFPHNVLAKEYETVSSIGLKKEPTDTSKIIFVLGEGVKVEVLSEDGDWVKVQAMEKIGYIRLSALKALKSEKIIEIEETKDTLKERVKIEEDSTEKMENEETFSSIVSDMEEQAISEENVDGEELEVLNVAPVTSEDSSLEDEDDNEYGFLNGSVELDYYSKTLDDYVREQMIHGRVTRYSPEVGDWVALDYNNLEHRAYVKHYMDPENFIHDPIRRLMFMKLSYQDVSVEALNSMLVNKGVLTNKGAVFREASKNANIHPVYLIAHALLETGNGNSKLATGKMLANGKPTYNMFGIGAYDHNPEFLAAVRAYQEGWFTVDKAIMGGANFVSRGYINNPRYNQNTLYSMRYRLEGPDLWHQYATDARWAHSQSMTIYNDLQKIPPMKLQYKIPVFAK